MPLRKPGVAAAPHGLLGLYNSSNFSISSTSPNVNRISSSIGPMSQRENEEIWLRCGGDEGRYEAAMLAESVCFPDLFISPKFKI